MNEFEITIPRERPFSAVAGFVVGGIAVRHDLTLEALDDLQLALDSLLERDEHANDVDGDVNIRLLVTTRRSTRRSGRSERRRWPSSNAGGRNGARPAPAARDARRRGRGEAARRRLVGRAARSAARERGGSAMTRASDKALLRRYHEEGDLAAREQLIEQYLSLVRSLARRYAYRGEQLDDLVQIGCIGLIKAIDRFDIDRGVELTTYATPNIIGEIKRHFRDKGWAVRVPRGLQELNVQLSKIVEEQTVQLGRSPTIPELAKAAGVEEEEVLEALESGRAYTSLSLSAGGADEDGELDPLESLGTEEHQYSVSEDRAVLAPGFRALDERERAHPAPALLRRADAVPDRAAGRDLADARVAADPPGAREDPRGDRGDEQLEAPKRAAG